MSQITHIIEFGPKFCPAQLDILLKEDHWKKSFSADIKTVIFDLTVTEWINTEEIIFLFAWMYKLQRSGRNISLILPFAHEFPELKTVLTPQRRQYLEKNWRMAFPEDDSPANIKYNTLHQKARHNLNVSLMTNWNLLYNPDLKNIKIENLLPGITYNKKIDYKFTRNTGKVIPFTRIESTDDGSVLHFEDVFQEAITKNKLLEIEEDLANILNYHGCYSVFESKILTNVIFQELFFNSLQHAYDIGQVKECFTGASFKQEMLEYANEEFAEERELQTLDFFKDKEAIRKKILADYPKINNKGPKTEKRRKARLHRYHELLPMSYIKFTFLDFGKGYTATLGKRFLETKDNMLQYFSDGFAAANEDSQIIEYAYLLETSCNPIDQNMEYYRFVPRGLFFLVDMVRRNKGIIKIRSGRGKVFYDFSDKLYVSINNNQPSASIHNPYNIRDAVIHSSDEDIPFFEGTMISILLPGRTKNQENIRNNRDARIVSPVRLENELLNSYVYYKNKDREKSHLYQVTEIPPPTYELISLTYTFHRAIREFNEAARGNAGNYLSETPKSFYNYSFSALVKEIRKYSGKNCVIFFDFEGLHYTAQVLKILYYLLETPYINEVTKAVIINLDKISHSIIGQLNTKNLDENTGPKLYKPIPCLSFKDKNSPPDIQWIGLKNAADGPVLNRLLMDNDLKDKERRVDLLYISQNAEGNLFMEFEGRLYSFF